MLYTHHEYREASNAAMNLNADLADGSLDEYSKKEAEQVLENYSDNTKNIFVGWMLGFIGGTAAVFSLIVYESDKIPEEVQQEE